MKRKLCIIMTCAITAQNITAQGIAFKADIDSMTPMKYQPRSGLTDFSLEFKNDSAFVYLPYMGEVYNPAYGNDGLHFNEPCTNIKVTNRKKNDGKDISFSVKHDIVNYDFHVTLYDNSNIDIHLLPSNAQSCSYSGQWENIQNETKSPRRHHGPKPEGMPDNQDGMPMPPDGMPEPPGDMSVPPDGTAAPPDGIAMHSNGQRRPGGHGGHRPGGERNAIKLGGVSATGHGQKEGDNNAEGNTFTGTGNEENVIQVLGGTFTMKDCKVEKLGGNTQGGDGSSFYGTNSALCTNTGGTINMDGGTIDTDAKGANAAVAYGGTINISNVVIRNKQDMSRGIHATGGGIINATNLDIRTEGTSSSVIATDRGGGTVTVNGGKYWTSGYHSAVAYSTGDITLSDCCGESTQGEIGVIEGDNTITYNNCDITSGSKKRALMILQSGSGDAQGYNGRITINGGKMTVKEATTPFCEVPTRMTGTLTLKDVEIVNPGKVLMYVDYNKQWRTQGGIGNLVLSTDKKWEYEGDAKADETGTINVTVEKNVKWSGSINSDNKAKEANITINGTWELSADSYVNSITKGKDAKIHENGFKLIVRDK